MNGVKSIRNLEDLLSASLKNKEKIVNSDISVLTAPGENYGSIVLRIVIKIKNVQTEEYRTIDAVGKIVPESKKVQELFNSQVTFRNEYRFYSSIVPLLNKFVRKKGNTRGLNFTAPFLGGRVNLNNNEEFVTDAVILMQNLKSLGYTIGKKTEGLSLEASKIAIESLANFHAVGLALKLEESQTFENELRPYFSDYVPEDDFLQMVKEKLFFTLRNNNFTEDEIEKVSAAMNRDGHKKDISDIWGTMIHYDTWTNNLMILYKENVPVHSVIVDFQDFGFGTPLNDLMFFLFTSLQVDIMQRHLDELLQYYYKMFIRHLTALRIDTEKYTEKSFDKEMELAVKNYEYCHSIWMLVPVMQDDLKTMEELHEEGAKNWNDKHVQRIVHITRLGLERRWL